MKISTTLEQGHIADYFCVRRAIVKVYDKTIPIADFYGDNETREHPLQAGMLPNHAIVEIFDFVRHIDLTITNKSYRHIEVLDVYDR